MKSSARLRSVTALLVVFCLLLLPLTAFAKKGSKNFKRGMQFEAAQKWEQAAQEFTLAVAADPANVDYQLHYRRAMFNASQMFMQQGRALAEQKDFIGAYNAFRQAYGYDPVNQLALSEMERMQRLQDEKTGNVSNNGSNVNGNSGGSVTRQSVDGASINPSSYQQQQQQQQQDNGGATPAQRNTTGGAAQEPIPSSRSEQLRVINYSGDLKSFIRSLADQLSLNVIFDRQSFAQPRNIDLNLRDVTTAQALDYIFLQEGLFFQKLSRRTILVADQGRRAQYQQLVIRTFYLSNTDPTEVRNIIQAAIPPSQGRPQIIVIPDKVTNSLTVRDTAENVRLIGQILESIDKDRAEVVMDVNIYEVSQSDLLQLGNQLGPSDGTVNTLGVTTTGQLAGSRLLGRALQAYNGVGAALILPSSTIQALQSRNRTKLIASTQVHAFNNEESSARIGQRVPVQTAQTYPFGFQNNTGNTTTTGNQFSFPGGGFPVINYEPTGLTLKFTPQVFPNLDVQVKMSIESKDVLNPGSNTPTFTERTITGTARIQNNRTMMLASVAQDRQSNGRSGLPLVGLVPILGRLFTAPRSDNFQTDIVIAVTPKVLRAPAVTPRDEELRPSGTLSSPTIGTLEAMIQEDDRNDQLAAARQIPKNVVVQLPDAEPPAYVPAPKSMLENNGAQTTAAANTSATMSGSNNAAQAVNNSQASTNQATSNQAATNVSLPFANSLQLVPQPISTALSPAPISNTAATATTGNALLNATANAPESQSTTQTADQSSTTPAPRSIDVAAALKNISPDGTNQPAESKPTTADAPAASGTSNASNAQANDVAPPVMEKPVESLVQAGPGAQAIGPVHPVELRLMTERQEMRAGERQRLALALTSTEPLGALMLRLSFDPRVIAVRGISQGSLLMGKPGVAPTLMQSIDPSGSVLVSVTTPINAPLKTGMNILLFLEVEALTNGESEIKFDSQLMRLATADGRDAPLNFVPVRIVVK